MSSPAESEKAAAEGQGTSNVHHSVTRDAELEKRDAAVTENHLRRKLDRHLLPLVFVLYMFAFLDRGNIGNARIAGMATDLDLVGTRYDWLLTIFYITYILFNWVLLFWKIYPPHIVGAVIVFLWGLISTLQAAVQTWAGAMVLRFFLGVFEAGFGPGIMYLLSFFYLKNEVGLRCGIFASSGPLASTFTGILAYGITSGHSKLAPWRLLFLVEGLPVVILAPVTFFFLPDSPDKARFLNKAEQQVAKARAIRQAGTNDRIGASNVKFSNVIKTLLDIKVWAAAVMYFSANVSYASLPLFLPTILLDMGYSGNKAQGLSAPPNLAAFVAAMTMAWIADRTQQRGLALSFSGVVAGIGYLLLATVDSVGVKYFATFLAAAGVFSTIPNINAWILNNGGSDARRGSGLVLINLVGQCGPLLGTRIYPVTDAPRYVNGMAICSSFMFLSAVLALALRVFLQRENRKRDRIHGRVTEMNQAKDNVGVENDDNPQFRFVL